MEHDLQYYRDAYEDALREDVACMDILQRASRGLNAAQASYDTAEEAQRKTHHALRTAEREYREAVSGGAQ